MIVQLDSRRRLSLGGVVGQPAECYRVEVDEAGVITMTPQAIIDQWVLDQLADPDFNAALRTSLNNAAAGKSRRVDCTDDGWTAIEHG